MRLIAANLVLLLSAGAASAQSCTSQAADKKLAGAAKTSFLNKCERDAGEACEARATDRKLFGAARASFTKNPSGPWGPDPARDGSPAHQGREGVTPRA